MFKFTFPPPVEQDYDFGSGFPLYHRIEEAK